MKIKAKKGPWFFFIFLLMISGVALGQNEFQKFSLQDLELLERLNFTDESLDLLRKNGFVVVPGNEKEIFDVYVNNKKNNHPIFVTTDAVLHTSHVFFDNVLRILEIKRLNDMSRELTNQMLQISEKQYQKAHEEEVKQAARLNIGFFSVAKKIFNTGYEPGYELDKLVNQELKNISEHQGIKFRALLDYIEQPYLMTHPYAYEDYSQYIPRGHYTRNETFKNYFKVMMWYGRIDFKLKPGKTEQAELHGRKMTLQALLMADALLRDERAYELWEKIYKPTVYFVGKTDDLNVDHYISLIKEIYPSGQDIDKYRNEELLSEFIQKAMKFRPPKILSGMAYKEDGEFGKTHMGFRFMGQRFIPDSYIFQQLVYGVEGLIYRGDGRPFTMEMIPNVGPARAFPRGLDVMAVLGSYRALEILEQEGDTDYQNYDKQLNKLKKEFSSLTQKQWTQNLYWRWLYSLIPLVKENREGNEPDFMKSQSWPEKELMTALGSWTELRHDTILYAKQSYTMMGKAPQPQPRLTYGYVEPYPQVYHRIKDMMTQLKLMNRNLSLEIPEVQSKIEKFEYLLETLKTISGKELGGRSITKQERSLIWNIGSHLKELTEFPESIQKQITSKTDERMDIIADVHTDPNTSQVLEEGVGSPFHIYVIVTDQRKRRLCHGAVFSYYEFKHPLDDRLTDEKWQKMGKENQRPPLPQWTQSFIADSQVYPGLSLDFYTDNLRTHKQRIFH